MRHSKISPRFLWLFLGLVCAIGLGILMFAPMVRPMIQNIFPSPTPSPIPTPIETPTPTLSPTPRPLTFAEMNTLYGPCAYLPTLFWHHIQKLDKAKELGRANISVDVDAFRQQMRYLKDKGYTPVHPDALIAFFDNGTPLPSKPILLTFDDAYDDFGTDAAPVLREFGFAATVFVPSGLVNNPGYLSWDTMKSLVGSGIYFANHTWSHKSFNTSPEVIEREITTADTQLTQHGFNASKVFAYPYGTPGPSATGILQRLGYKIAFTTSPGSIQCKQQRFILPRTRIGNGGLSAYGI